MAQHPKRTLFGLTPIQHGVASLFSALLICAIWPLVAVSFVVVYIDLALLLVSACSGIVGLVKGIQSENRTAAVTGGLAVVLTGSLTVWAIWSLLHF